MVSSTKQLIDNWRFGSDPFNSNLDDLTFEYDQRLIPWQSIDRIYDNIIEMFNYSSIIDLYLEGMKK